MISKIEMANALGFIFILKTYLITEHFGIYAFFRFADRITNLIKLKMADIITKVSKTLFFLKKKKKNRPTWVLMGFVYLFFGFILGFIAGFIDFFALDV